ncbi:transglutaminase-like cysteine peptidase [Novosphingobium sp. RD2P27]|uniref:Transglutaminase-like cysteine peptidase n=1 Tax=Novosphingobium kalidii TaxID=3230299 RepID=A0ABV2CZZ7_9SPHN
MTSRFKGLAVLLAGCGFVTGGPAMAAAAAGNAFIPLGEIADAPSGFVEMCERDSALCFAGIEQAPLRVEEEFGAQDLISDELVAAEPSQEAFSNAQCLLLSRLSSYVASWAPGNTGSPVRAGLSDPVPGAARRGCGESGLSVQSAVISSAAFVRPVAPYQKTWLSRQSVAGEQPAADRQPLSRKLRTSSQAGGTMALLKKVNSRVNRHVRQVSDYDVLGTDERWDRPGSGREAVGDCEDLAIEKRMQLVEAGFAPNALFYSTVYKHGFGLHAVLIARTEQGDVVLDSLSPHIIPWNKAKYSWLRVQSTEDPTVWRRIGAPVAVPVLAAEASHSAAGIS